jgi:hypothetical protein
MSNHQSPLLVMVDKAAAMDGPDGDVDDVLTTATSNLEYGLASSLLLSLRTPLKLRSFSDDSEMKSVDEDDNYPSMLMDSVSDDESVQELLERASANKSGSNSKFSSSPTNSTKALDTIRLNEGDVMDGDDIKQEDSQLTGSRRNLWPNLAVEVNNQNAADDSDNNKSQVSHTFVGDVVDDATNDSDNKSQFSHTFVGDVSDETHHEETASNDIVVPDDDEQSVARAEKAALAAQSALVWLEQHKVDGKGISTSSGGEEDDDNVINTCLDSLQQLEMQQDDEYARVAEHNACNIQEALKRLQQQQVVTEDGEDEIILGSDNEGDDEPELGQYFTVMDALNPPSVADASAPAEQNPNREQSKAMAASDEMTMRVEDPTSSVTEGDDFDSDSPSPTKEPSSISAKRRRLYFCLGIVALLAVVAIVVGVVIGLTSESTSNTPAASVNQQVVAAVPTTAAPSITVSDKPTAPTRPSPTKIVPSTSPTRSTKSPTQSTSISPSTSLTDIRINAGAAVGFTDTKGRYWQPDSSFTGGTAYKYQSQRRTVANTRDSQLFLTQRYGTQFLYSFPLLAFQVYQVDLYFAELYDGAFAVDIFRNVGAFNATVQTFFIPVADGSLDVVFTGTTSNATIAALQITASDLAFPNELLTAAPTQAP